jgi:hypothetical protein
MASRFWADSSIDSTVFLLRAPGEHVAKTGSVITLIGDHHGKHRALDRHSDRVDRPRRPRTTSESLCRIVAGAYSANTIRAVASDARVFHAWCAGSGLPYGPPSSPPTVAAIVDATGKTKKPATVSRYVASIEHLHRTLDLASPGGTNAVRLALGRLRRETWTRQDQAKALR